MPQDFVNPTRETGKTGTAPAGMVHHRVQARAMQEHLLSAVKPRDAGRDIAAWTGPGRSYRQSAAQVSAYGMPL